MKYRHWQKIQQITGFTFDLERPGFCLKDILEAPLLPNKEDIEDVCISALKEKDIEAKLRAVTSEWSTQELSFMVCVLYCKYILMNKYIFMLNVYLLFKYRYSKTEENFFCEVTQQLKLLDKLKTV